MREYLGLSSKSSTVDNSTELSSEELEKQVLQLYGTSPGWAQFDQSHQNLKKGQMCS